MEDRAQRTTRNVKTQIGDYVVQIIELNDIVGELTLKLEDVTQRLEKYEPKEIKEDSN